MSGIRYLVVQTGCESYAFRRAAGSCCGACTLNGMEKTQVRPALGKLGALPRAPRGLASPDPPTEPAEAERRSDGWIDVALFQETEVQVQRRHEQVTSSPALSLQRRL